MDQDPSSELKFTLMMVAAWSSETFLSHHITTGVTVHRTRTWNFIAM